MTPRSFNKSLRLFFSAILVAVLAISIVPVPAAQADVFTSDVAVKLVSAPRSARACQVFKAKFRVTNYGPDEAGGLYMTVHLPDQLGYLDILDMPESLASGESTLVTVIIKVVAYTPGSSSSAWVGAGVNASPYPDTSIDPNPANNDVDRPLRLIGRRAISCP